jgi:spoIIIJ-associated protein
LQVLIDIDGYRAGLIRELVERSQAMAERAVSFKYDVEMHPMSAYERLIVHTALADTPHVKTESTGEGRDRRVVIRYVE